MLRQQFGIALPNGIDGLVALDWRQVDLPSAAAKLAALPFGPVLTNCLGPLRLLWEEQGAAVRAHVAGLAAASGRPAHALAHLPNRDGRRLLVRRAVPSEEVGGIAAHAFHACSLLLPAFTAEGISGAVKSGVELVHRPMPRLAEPRREPDKLLKLVQLPMKRGAACPNRRRLGLQSGHSGEAGSDTRTKLENAQLHLGALPGSFGQRFLHVLRGESVVETVVDRPHDERRPAARWPGQIADEGVDHALGAGEGVGGHGGTVCN